MKQGTGAHSRRPDQRCETLGRKQPVAADDQFGHFAPVNLVYIQPQRHPAARSEVRRQIESRGVRGHQRGIVAVDYLGCHGNDAIAVMVK